jgi:hypothetical protein
MRRQGWWLLCALEKFYLSLGRRERDRAIANRSKFWAKVLQALLDLCAE